MENSDFVGKMNAFRESRQISKAQMARDLGTDAGTLGNILRGLRGVPTEMLYRFLAVYTDVSAEWFMRGQGEMLLASSPIGMDSAALAAENQRLCQLVARQQLRIQDLERMQRRPKKRLPYSAPAPWLPLSKFSANQIRVYVYFLKINKL